jgi:hypothetical protein
MEVSMFMDTVAAKEAGMRNKPMDSFCVTDNNSGNLFDIYLEFILFWIQSEGESYQNASTIARGWEEKEIFSSMAAMKIEMFNALNADRADGRGDWFDIAFGSTSSQSSTTSFVIDSEFNLIHNPMDAFRFAYRKEYQGLSTFEKLGRSNLEPAVCALLDKAARLQQQHIFYLDTRLANSREICKQPDEANHDMQLEYRR